MKEQLDKLEQQALKALQSANDVQEIDLLRTEYLGRKGAVTLCLRNIAGLSPEDRPEIGRLANEIKQRLETAVKDRMKALEEDTERTADALDVTLPRQHKRPAKSSSGLALRLPKAPM
jgi:phenylalanyl-tRNA synthetase alpha chain